MKLSAMTATTLAGFFVSPAAFPRGLVSDAGLSASVLEGLVSPVRVTVEVVNELLVPPVVDAVVVDKLVVELDEDVAVVVDEGVVEVVVAGPPPGRGTCTVAPAP